MLYLLLHPLQDEFSFLRILGYITFRTVMAAMTSLGLTLYLGPRFFRLLRKINFKENIRDDGPESHQEKAGTPTMGGLLIVSALMVSVLLWSNILNAYVINITICTLLLATLGFVDDFSKATGRLKYGMSPKIKFFSQLTIAAIFSLILYYTPGENSELVTQLYLPFLKEPIFDMHWFAIPFWIIFITGFSNAVNLTDGLDGLAAGLSAISLSALAGIAYLTGIAAVSRYLLIPHVPDAGELVVVIAAIIGACVGFLWYNSHPAQVFMGDTGSLALGGAIAMASIMIKREVLLLILGGIFVAEAASVILQVGSYKLRNKKRIFLMAPLHHHYELKGWHENKVVVRFWIIGVFLALVSFTSLKII